MHRSGLQSFVVRPSPNVVSVTEVAGDLYADLTRKIVIEYYYEGFDHYFVTWLPGEISILDNRACPDGMTAIYRVFSNRADAKHRYMADRSLRDAMVARGWVAEGDGPDRVVMCTPF